MCYHFMVYFIIKGFNMVGWNMGHPIMLYEMKKEMFTL